MRFGCEEDEYGEIVVFLESLFSVTTISFSLVCDTVFIDGRIVFSTETICVRKEPELGMSEGRPAAPLTISG